MINSSSVRFRRLFLCAFIDCLALMMILLFFLYLVCLALVLYIYDIDILLVIRSFVVGFIIGGSCSFVGGF